MNPNLDHTTKVGTAGGTLLAIFGSISGEDLLKTAILAAVGAVVSFGVTLLLKFVIKRSRR